MQFPRVNGSVTEKGYRLTCLWYNPKVASDMDTYQQPVSLIRGAKVVDESVLSLENEALGFLADTCSY